MKDFDLNGKYSFAICDKSYIFPNKRIDDEPSNTISEDYYDIFCTNDKKILQEYCIADGSTNLYRQITNNKFAILYEQEFLKDTGYTEIDIYTPKTYYHAILQDNTIVSLFCLTSQNFTKTHLIKNPILSNMYVLRNMKMIISNFHIIQGTNNLYNEFKHLYTKYRMASAFIPASCIINNIKTMAIKYIATGKIDKDDLINKYIHLQNFQEFCSNSITELAPFVDDPSKVDYRQLLNSIDKYLNNIDNLKNMYLSEELEEDIRSL